MTVGEAGGTTPEQAMDYIDQKREDKEMCMVFNTDVSPHKKSHPNECGSHIPLITAPRPLRTF